MEIISFEQALHEASISSNHKHLILGNGFSIALMPDIFSYESLFDEADFSGLSPNLRKTFEVLKTKDFEIVIQALKQASVLAKLYLPLNKEISKTMEQDAEGLKNILIKTIASRHPERPNDIKEEHFESCRKFLSNFEKKYTFNYDLLLYWTLMHEPSKYHPKKNDGFFDPSKGEDEYVVWNPGQSQQDIYFLHGALHFFDAGEEIQKFTWSRTEIKLVDQIRHALNNKKYPLVVSEGTSRQKKNRIMHSAYLGRSYSSLPKISGSLFIFGHSMANNDDHILSLIPQNFKINNLFVSIRGNINNESNQFIIKKTEKLRNERRDFNNNKALNIYFYKADSAKVWG